MDDSTFIPLNNINLLGFGSSTNKIKPQQWLIDNGYGSNSIVYSIINKIVTTSLDIPLVVKDSKGEIVETGKVYDALQEPAIYRGEYLNTKDWKEYAMTYLLTSGNLYQRKVNLEGFNQTILEVLPSGIVVPETETSYLIPPSKYTITDRSKNFPVPYDEMHHTKYINPTHNGLINGIGLSPLQAGLLALRGNTDVQEALAVMVQNQGTRGILSPKNGGMPTDGGMLKKFADAVRKKITGVNKVNSVHVSNTPVEYTAMGMSSADLQLIESGILTDRQLCNMYSVDSKLFNDPSSSTFNNLKEATKGLYENAVIPTLNKVVASFNESIAKELDPSQKVEVDTSKIVALQPDKKEQADKNKANSKSIAEILNMNTSPDGKVEALIWTLDMPEETARNIVSNGDGRED